MVQTVGTTLLPCFCGMRENAKQLVWHGSADLFIRLFLFQPQLSGLWLVRDTDKPEIVRPPSPPSGYTNKKK